ncbi:hypothetical protein BGW80DRAFT_1109773, partial [Lactifluus volemus]
SPLHRVGESKNIEIVQLLLSYDADIHARNFNSTPLHTASLGWNVEVVRALFEH